MPSVQERFSDWVTVHNEKTVQQLPGATPEPGSELDAIVNFDAAQQEAQLEQDIASSQPTPYDPTVTPDPAGCLQAL